MLSFDALIGSSDRNHYRGRMEDLIAIQIAAQGDGKTMKNFLRAWRKRAYPGEEEQTDAGAFKLMYGSGI